MMSRAAVRASLALWRRREKYRQKKLDAVRLSARKDSGVVTNAEADRIHKWRTLHAQAVAMVNKRKQQLERASAATSTGTVWMPGARRVYRTGAGPFIDGFKPRAVWHTTEGMSDATGTLDANGAHPHFELLRDGTVIQYLPINVSAKALEHRAGTIDTNRAHAVQIEVVGRAADPHWPAAQVSGAHRISAFLLANAGIPKRAATFSSSAHRMSDSAWRSFTGHCGHQHVPGNSHWDPGAIPASNLF